MSVRVAAAGVDTWKLAWRLDDQSSAARHVAEMCTRSIARGGSLPEPIAGHRVGLQAGGLLFAEGHPVQGRLARPDELPAARERLVLAMLEAGVPVPVGRSGEDLYGQRFEGDAGVRRLDTTCDLQVGSSAEGLAILAGVAAVARDMPRSKANVWFGADGLVQTVGLHGYAGRRMTGRFYDKGLESGQAARGRLLRPEDQRRWDRESSREVAELTGHYVRDKFVRRFAPLWRASKGVTVGGQAVLVEKLVELVQADEISFSQAEQLGGHLLLAAATDRLPEQLRPSPATRRRRRAALREHGLVLADGVLQEVEVNLERVFEQLMDCDHWERQG